MSKYPISSFILGILGWLPIIGMLFSVLAIIFSINRKKQKNTPVEDALLLLGMIFGILGLLSIIPVSYLASGATTGITGSLAQSGVFDAMAPMFFIGILLFSIIYILLDFTKLDNHKKSLITAIAAFILSLATYFFVMIGNAFIRQVFTSMNSAMPILLFCFLLGITTFLPLAILAGNKLKFYIVLLIVNIALVYFTSFFPLAILLIPLAILLRNHKEIFKSMNMNIARVFAILFILAEMVALALNYVVLTPLVAYIYTDPIMIDSLAAFGLIMWAWMTFNIFRAKSMDKIF